MVARILVQNFLRYDQDFNVGRVAMKWHGLIGLAYPALKNRTIECQLMCIISRSYDNRAKIEAGSIDVGPHQCAGLLQYIEYYSGSAKLSKKLIESGLRGCSFDILYTADHNMLMAKGLRLFLDAATVCEEKAWHWWGTPCSSFVILCSAHSQRAESNGWEGSWTERDFVLRGNCQALVCSLGIFLGWACECLPVLEQPLSSCMPHLECVKTVLSFCGFEKTCTYMGAFNGKSVKPLQLWHLPGFDFENLARPRPDHNAFIGLVSRGEDGRFTGMSADVQASGEYTSMFGEAVAQIVRNLL